MLCKLAVAYGAYSTCHIFLCRLSIVVKRLERGAVGCTMVAETAMDGANELELVRKAQQGDQASYGMLVDLYGGAMLAIAYSRVGNFHISQDIVQDTFLLGFENLGKLRSPNRFGAWLKTIARNLCANWHKSESYRKRLREDSAALHARLGYENGASADERMEHAEMRSLIDQALDCLSVGDREAIVLYYFEGQSVGDAAKSFSISPAAMRKRLERARNRLRDVLTDRVEAELINAGRKRPTSAHVLAAIPLGASFAKVGSVAAVLPSTPMLHLTGLLGKTGGLVMGINKSTGIVAAVCVLLAAGGLFIAREQESIEKSARPETEVARSLTAPEDVADPFVPIEPETDDQPASSESEAVPSSDSGLLQSETDAEPVPVDETKEKSGQRNTASVSGRVMDSDTNPIEGAELEAVHVGEEAGTVHSDAYGNYRFADLKRNVAYRITASASRYGSVAKLAAVPGTGDVAGLDFVLESGATVAGYVVDTSDSLIANAQVLMHANQGGASGMTDSQGEFEIQDVAPGTYRFAVEQGGRYQSAVNEPLVVAASDMITGLEIVVEAGQGIIEGFAIDEQGYGVSDVDVHAHSVDGSARAQTDSAGYYSLNGLGKHAVKIRFEHPDYAETFLTNIPVGTMDADVVMLRKGSISGVVIDAGTFEPIDDFTIMIITEYENPDGIPFEGQDSHGFSSARGRFVIEDVHPGFATLTATAAGYTAQKAADIVVASGEETSGIEIQLSPGNIVRGTVMDASNARPVAEATVYLGGIPDFMSEAQTLKVVTASDGSFVLREVPAGEQVLGAKHPDFAPTSISVNVQEGDETQVTIELDTSGMIAGHVTENGEVFPGARVMLGGGPQMIGQPATHTEADGSYEFKGLATGTYRIIAALPSPEAASGREPLLSAEVEVEEGYITEHDFDFKTGTGVIEGYIKENGEPISGIDANVLVVSTSGDRRIAGGSPVDETGYYRVPGLAADSYRIRVSASYTTALGERSGGSWKSGGSRSIGEGFVQLDDGATAQVDIDIADSGSEE